jgi:hypothetical protein
MEAGDIILILTFGIPALAVILIVWWMKRDFSSRSKWAGENRISQQNAKPAKAKIISASQGLQGGEIRKMIFFTFEINNGYSEPYNASAGWFVDTLHLSKIEEGKVIDVRVDRSDPKKIYPAAGWATYTEGYDSGLSVDKLRGRQQRSIK